MAGEYQARGYFGARALRGGYQAWHDAVEGSDAGKSAQIPAEDGANAEPNAAAEGESPAPPEGGPIAPRETIPASQEARPAATARSAE